MKKSTFINAGMLEGYAGDDVYTSYMLMGDELVGEPVINVNWGTLKPHTRLDGGSHEKAELYFVFKCQEGASVVTGQGEEEIRYFVKPGDVIHIPGGCFHWIDNRDCDEEFIIVTMWPNQEQNGAYHARLKAWGTSFRFKEGAKADTDK